MADLATVLQFIATIEQQNLGKSVYDIANSLRGYTKPAYTTRTWTIATGFEQPFIEGTLNQEVILAGEATDFAHLIASFSDQINEPGFQWSDFTRWSADHTSWAGDIGSAIAISRSQPEKVKTLSDAFDRFAPDTDYAADVAAFIIGSTANANAQRSVATLIAEYNAKPYAEHVRSFIKQRFGGVIEDDRLQNPAKLEAEIRNCVFAYLELSPDSSILKAMRKV